MHYFSVDDTRGAGSAVRDGAPDLVDILGSLVSECNKKKSVDPNKKKYPARPRKISHRVRIKDYSKANPWGGSDASQ